MMRCARRSTVWLRVDLLIAGLAVALACASAEACENTCGDFNGDVVVNAADFDAFVECFGADVAASPTCSCGDLDGSGIVDLHDFATFAVLFGSSSDEVPPNCSGAVAAAADLVAFRPTAAAGAAAFVRTVVEDDDEASSTLGPGIRINASGDSDPNGEDDLIEVRLEVDPPGAALALGRSDAALRVWTTSNKQAGTEIAFVGDKSGVLPLGQSETQLTLWVEWADAAHGEAALTVEPPEADVAKDTLVFHTLRAIVLALGGEDQQPSDPPDPNHGTFVVARKLYELGYDVHMFDEDNVAADGSGVVYNEAATAIRDRGVGSVAIFGYSHGGGSTYDLADLLDLNRAGLGVFEIQFTSYVDSVSNNSNIDTGQELRRPPATAFHLNHYQVGSFFEDLGLDGGPVPDSNPPPSGLNVETTPWGADSTHFTVDDYVEVRSLIESSLENSITQP